MLKKILKIGTLSCLAFTTAYADEEQSIKVQGSQAGDSGEVRTQAKDDDHNDDVNQNKDNHLGSPIAQQVGKSLEEKADQADKSEPSNPDTPTDQPQQQNNKQQENKPLTLEQAEQVFKQFDKNNDRLLTKQQLLFAMTNNQQSQAQQALKELNPRYAKHDPASDGFDTQQYVNMANDVQLAKQIQEEFNRQRQDFAKKQEQKRKKQLKQWRQRQAAKRAQAKKANSKKPTAKKPTTKKTKPVKRRPKNTQQVRPSQVQPKQAKSQQIKSVQPQQSAPKVVETLQQL